MEKLTALRDCGGGNVNVSYNFAWKIYLPPCKTRTDTYFLDEDSESFVDADRDAKMVNVVVILSAILMAGPLHKRAARSTKIH